MNDLVSDISKKLRLPPYDFLKADFIAHVHVIVDSCDMDMSENSINKDSPNHVDR